MLIRAANIENISLPALVFGRFVIHQPLVVILGLLDAEIAGHGVHGDERFVEPFIQASQRLSQVEYWQRPLRVRNMCSMSAMPVAWATS